MLWTGATGIASIETPLERHALSRPTHIVSKRPARASACNVSKPADNSLDRPAQFCE